MADITESRPDSGLALQVKVLHTFPVAPSSLTSSRSFIGGDTLLDTLLPAPLVCATCGCKSTADNTADDTDTLRVVVQSLLTTLLTTSWR